jgi:type I restriction enzyme, S subunit
MSTLINKWKETYLGSLINLEYGAGLVETARTKEGYPVFGSSGIVDKHRNYLVEAPGIVVGRKGSIGSIFWTNEAFYPIDTTYYVQQKTSDYLRWIYWCLAYLPLKQLDTSTGVPGLNRNDVYRLVFSVPPVPEQLKITEILDTIANLITLTDRHIAKLKQAKAGLLHDLLTCGIDEHGELRDPIAHPEQFKKTGTAIGRIPKDWEIRTCDSLCREIVVGIVIRPAQYYQASGVPVLRSANIRESGIDPSDLVFMSETSNRLMAKSMVKSGDVVTVRTGYPGTSCIVSPDWDSSNCVDILISRPGSEIDSGFLALWINSDFGKGQVLRGQGGLAQQHFNVGELQKLLVVKPSIDEQKRIQKALATYTTQIQQKALCREKLKLLKKGLMADLLTGRVRVKLDTIEEG